MVQQEECQPFITSEPAGVQLQPIDLTRVNAKSPQSSSVEMTPLIRPEEWTRPDPILTTENPHSGCA